VTVEVTFWPQVPDDYRALPTNALKLMATKYLLQLVEHPRLGLALKDHPLWGDLSDCRKIFLDETHTADPRWRIIYRLLPNDDNPEVADVIIIGPREDDAVYYEVMSRLERALGISHPRFANPS